LRGCARVVREYDATRGGGVGASSWHDVDGSVGVGFRVTGLCGASDLRMRGWDQAVAA
jgi:hypothetical protein